MTTPNPSLKKGGEFNCHCLKKGELNLALLEKRRGDFGFYP
jgi:hypothetical protein